MTFICKYSKELDNGTTFTHHVLVDAGDAWEAKELFETRYPNFTFVSSSPWNREKVGVKG